MGVNSLITWAVIDPVMRAVTTEMRDLSLAFCRWGNAWEIRTSNSALSFMWDAGFGLCVWVGCLRRKFQSLHFSHCSEAETRVSTLESWYYGGAEMRLSSSASRLLRRGFQPSHLGPVLVAVPLCVWSLDSTFWWLYPSDFWTVYSDDCSSLIHSIETGAYIDSNKTNPAYLVG